MVDQDDLKTREWQHVGAVEAPPPMSEADRMKEALEDFKRTGGTPLAWQIYSRELVCAANVLRGHREAIMEKGESVRFEDHLASSHMPVLYLYGLAVETMLKGLVIAQGLEATVGGKLNGKLKTHDLTKLWGDAKLPITDRQPDLLRRLEWCVRTGRYPIGLQPDIKAPALAWVALTNVHEVLELLETAEQALRDLLPNTILEKTNLGMLGLGQPGETPPTT